VPINDFNRIFPIGHPTPDNQFPSCVMRTILISLTTLLCFGSSIARAEQHRFLVANDADGYGVDRCLASGEKCGAAAANAYCRMQAFAAAAAYHKVDQNDLPGAVSKETSDKCQTGRCDVVAIVCLR
jgi:hypothetical protein